MNGNKYLKDLKNLQPLPLDRMPVGSPQSTVGSRAMKTESGSQNTEIQKKENLINKIPNQLEEIRAMEKLTNSKTLWGFGIAVFIYIVQNVLIALNIAGPDNLILKAIIEAVIAISGFFGVYGVRDALRKMNL